MMQGDGYNLAIRILNNAGNPVTPLDVGDVEIRIGNLRKTYKKAQLTYTDGVWLFPLTQSETLSFPPYAIKSQVRVLWNDGAVEGQELLGVRVQESMSKEVL